MSDAPESIGAYHVLEPLGRGGMGIVYRAMAPDGRVVALKTVRVGSEAQLAGLRREIHALARLRHPGIVHILDEGVWEGLPWYAMELLEGVPLKRYARARGWRAAQPLAEYDVSTEVSFPEPWWTSTLESGAPAGRWKARENDTSRTTEDPAASGDERGLQGNPRRDVGRDLVHLLSVVRSLCTPLAYLHGEGLVHRDLKPENVLVRPDGVPILVDFGLVTQFSGDVSREALTAAAVSGGTVSTMAPEQIRGELVDARADLYSLGCILYELLVGRPPFVGQLPVEVLWQHLYAEPQPPSVLAPDVPEPLERLILQLLAKDPRQRLGYAMDLAAALGRLGAVDLAPSVQTRPRPYLYRPGFSGRQDALNELEEHLKRLADGFGGMILVGGASGVGKTRLVLEATRAASKRHIQVLSGECSPSRKPSRAGELGSGIPFSGLRRPLEAIADRCRGKGLQETARILGRRAKTLAPYAPGFRDLPSQEENAEPIELAPEAARQRLFGDLAETLQALAEDQPLLFALDDLQWADELTLGFLSHFARGVPSGGKKQCVLILGTYRTEELLEPLRDLHRLPGVFGLRLGNLEETAIGQMVADMLALSAGPPAFVRYLSRQSEGNPFFVAEYLRTAVREGVLWRDEAGQWRVAESDEEEATDAVYKRLPLPQSIRELVVRHFERLSGAAALIVEAAAILGREAETSMLASVAALGPLEMMEGTVELLRHQVMEDARLGALRFVHDKLREVAYERLDETRRLQLHRAAAQAFEALPLTRREEHLSELGQHWEMAREAEKARPFYLAAARKAVAVYARDEAERLYRNYLRLSPQPTAESIVARNELGQAILDVQGRVAEAIEQHELALDEARELKDAGMEGQCLYRLGIIHQELGRLDEAQILYGQALGIARSHGLRGDEARILNSLGLFAAERGELDAACRRYEQALTILREIGLRDREAVVLANFGILRIHEGRLSEARTIFAEVLSMCRELGNRLIEGRTLSNLAVISDTEGDLETALVLGERALAIHREVGDRRFEGLSLGNIAAATQRLGFMEQAWKTAHEALAIHRECGNSLFEGLVLGELATLNRVWRGNLAEAGEMVEQQELIFRRIGAVRELATCLCERGHLALARNQSARELLEEALSVAERLRAGPKSALGDMVSGLRRAQEAFEAHQPMFRGMRVEDLPQPFREALVLAGQIPS